MTELTANKDTERKAGKLESFLVENNVHIYKGAMVDANVSGYAVPAADVIGHRFLGEAYEECDNTLAGHSQGGKSVRVRMDGVLKVKATSLTQAMVGQKMYVKDDQTVDPTSSNYICAGRLVDYESGTAGWIDIGQRGALGDSPGRIWRLVKNSKDESGAIDYGEVHLDGVPTGGIYGRGSWINIEDDAVPPAGEIIVPWEGGIYEDGATMTDARCVFAGQYQAILTGTPASLHAWRLNTTKTITALIAAANPGSVGYDTGKAGSSVVGVIPIADVVGVGVVYVNVYSVVA